MEGDAVSEAIKLLRDEIATDDSAILRCAQTGRGWDATTTDAALALRGSRFCLVT
jgi:hypothetical protein